MEIIHKVIPRAIVEGEYFGCGSSHYKTKCGLLLGSGTTVGSNGVYSNYRGYQKDELLFSREDDKVTCEKCKQN